MTQHSLNSKTITKRNVAQSSVIFSVVVALITLGVIATVAYIDISEDIEAVAAKKSIPEMIAEQKVRSEDIKKQAELKSQAEDFVVVIDERVANLKVLEQKVKQVSDQLNFVTANLKAPEQVLNTHPVNQPNIQKALVDDAMDHQQFIKSVYDYNQSVKLSAIQSANMTGDAYFEFNWLFKARSSMLVDHDFSLNQNWSGQNNWNSKSF